MSHRSPGSILLITVALILIAPSALAINRGTTIAFCKDAVHGNCWVSKEVTENHHSVRFKCLVEGEDHWPSLMGAANYELKLQVNEAHMILVDRPKTGPVHDDHVYCRRITGAAPFSTVMFFHYVGRSLLRNKMKDHKSCGIQMPSGGGPKRKIR